MRCVFVFVVLIGLTGCGPLVLPMLPTLNAEDQGRIDQMWDNMLTPVQRVDRQTLLDANIVFGMYTMGVDRMHMTSEKYFHGGTVVMDIDCDRANPAVDQFTITVRDGRGRTLRRERYTRAEVEESAQVMWRIPIKVTGESGPLTVGQGKGETGAAQTPASTRAATEPTTQTAAVPATESATQPVETAEERKARLEFERRAAAVIAATQPARVDAAAEDKGDGRGKQ